MQFTSLYPQTLRDLPDALVLVTVDDATPFVVRKGDPEGTSVAAVLRSALDRQQSVLVRVAPDDAHRIVEAKLEHPEAPIDEDCPDRPDMTPKFWAAQRAEPDPGPDAVSWVATVPNCSSRRVSFFQSPRIRWIHPQHPRAKEMLETAWRSINEGRDVKAYYCSGAAIYLADLSLLPR